MFGFILNHIDTIPHIEALLLLWSSRPKLWTEKELASRLYIPLKTAKAILLDLVNQRLVAAGEEKDKQYGYFAGSAETDDLMEAVAETYRRDLVRVSTFIHTKAPSGVREFARAFKFNKEPD